MNNTFIIKVKILVLIYWSYGSRIYVDYWVQNGYNILRMQSNLFQICLFGIH